MKACGVVGSPVKNGNVDILVGRVLDGAFSRGAETRKIYLNDLSIRPCQSCGPNDSAAYCRFEDDMNEVYEALEQSDIVVLGSSVYFDTVSAQVKLMIDRCNCLTALVEGAEGVAPRFVGRLRGARAGVLVAVAGSDQNFSAIQATAAGFFTWINASQASQVLYSHDSNERGGVGLDADWMQKAFDAGVVAATRCASPRHG